MKVEIVKTGHSVSPGYPRLMISYRGTIVLFWAFKNGVVITPGATSQMKAGDFCQSFDMDNFSDFNGTVTLEND